MNTQRATGQIIGWGAAAVTLFTAPQIQADLFVSSQTSAYSGAVLRYNGDNGGFLSVFASNGGLADPLGLTYGPDGNLYVANGNGNQVLRYDGRSGASLGVFASGGGLQGPVNLTFGPDGNLYVSSGYSQVLRYDGKTGAFMGAFISDSRLAYPRGLRFGPDGDLYVVSYNQAAVLRYSPTGSFLNTFVSSGSGGLFTPSDLIFGPDGNLYVTGGQISNDGVFRYDGNTGAPLGLFAAVGGSSYPIDLAYGPDGNLYVSAQGSVGGVLRFNGQTGAFIDNFVTANSGGLVNLFGLAFSTVPEPSMVALLGLGAGFVLVEQRRGRKAQE